MQGDFEDLENLRFRIRLCIFASCGFVLTLLQFHLLGEEELYLQARENLMVRMNIVAFVQTFFVILPLQAIIYLSSLDYGERDDDDDRWEPKGDDPRPPSNSRRPPRKRRLHRVRPLVRRKRLVRVL